MKKSRLQSFRDYMAVSIRRKWWILGSFIIFAGLAGLFAKIVPDTYIATATIQIKPREIPSELVADLSASSTEQRLNIIQNTILSRTNLLEIVANFEERLKGYKGLDDQAKYLRLKDKITIDFPTERVRGSYLPITRIDISYRDGDPETARDIANSLVSFFLNQDREDRQDNVNGTADFFESELEKVRLELQESEKELQKLKSQYRYELPDQLDTNLRTLDRLQIDKQSNLEALDRLLSLRLDLEQRISAIPAELPREQARGADGVDPAIQAYRLKEQELMEARANKSEIHPDVRRLKAELEELRKGLPEDAPNVASQTSTAEAEDNSNPGMVLNPAYQTLKSQLQQVNTEIEIRENAKKRIEEQIAGYERRVANTSTAEQQMEKALRLNEDLSKRYASLRDRANEARLSESAESSEKGTQLQPLDPAITPLAPAPPSRPVMFLVGLLVSLLLGIGIAFAVDIASPVVFTQPELERVLQTKVLVEIPRITTPSDIRKSRAMAFVYGTCFLVLTSAYGGILYFLYTKHNRLAQILDPVIQRIQS